MEIQRQRKNSFALKEPTVSLGYLALKALYGITKAKWELSNSEHLEHYTTDDFGRGSGGWIDSNLEWNGRMTT